MDLETLLAIGNDRLHQLTESRPYKLIVDIKAELNGNWYWAKYTQFRVESEVSAYRLRIAGYSGTAGDSLARVNGMKFSTYDPDNVPSITWHCAIDKARFAGFWYYDCADAFINSDNADVNLGVLWRMLPVGSSDSEKHLTHGIMTLIRL